MQVIAEILSIPLPVPSRRWLYERMTARGYSEAIQHWLGSNLVPADGQPGAPANGQGLKWAFNITGARRPLGSYACTIPAAEILCGPSLLPSCLSAGSLWYCTITELVHASSSAQWLVEHVVVSPSPGNERIGWAQGQRR